jgi:hypothetical protein
MADDLNNLRAEFESWAKAEGLIHESHGLRSVWSNLDIVMKAYQAGAARRQPDVGVVSDEQVKEEIRKFSEAGARNPTDMMAAMHAAIESVVPASPVPASVNLLALLKEATDALDGGLWDFGPGQDEHDRCTELVARLRAALEEVVPEQVGAKGGVQTAQKTAETRMNTSFEGGGQPANLPGAVAPEQRCDSTLSNLHGMADCMDMVRQEFIEAGIIDKSVAPMFVANAVLGYIAEVEGRADAVDSELLSQVVRGYQRGTLYSSPSGVFGTIKLSYEPLKAAEQAFKALSTLIDRAIAAESAKGNAS